MAAKKERNRTVVAKDAVRVDGLKDVQLGFGKVARKIERIQFKRAAEHVVGVARGKMGNSITGTAASALRPVASNVGASIAFPKGGPGSGGEPAGYYPWLDFGGAKAAGRGVTSRPVWRFGKSRWAYGDTRRDFIKEGRYLYPAISDSKVYLEGVAGDAVEDAARSEGYEVKG
jgi:hypothetical protein